ncbi:MAG: type II toxin-antitoxin system MqsA family antitoxin, partial [Enterobacterales bacterium]|nr:type II toxin-antitoxin system MqsA family antitoxin [Enterobacterales bacterium]
FSRYETGKALPHVSTIKLLKLLDKYPELLEEIRN